MRKISTRMWVHEDSMPMLGTRLALRMTIVKLSDDGLWLWSPTSHNPQLENRIADMGVVKHIVAPSNGHNLFVEAWQMAFPDAGLYVASGIPRKRPGLRGYTLLRDLDAAPWASDLETLPMDGAPLFDEHMFFHARSKSLLVTDFFQHHSGATHKGLGKVVNKLLFEPIGFKGKCLAPPLKTRFGVKDRTALRASLDRLWELDIERVIPAHGAIFEQSAKDDIRRLCQRFYD
jgi:hypothetical protein